MRKEERCPSPRVQRGFSSEINLKGSSIHPFIRDARCWGKILLMRICLPTCPSGCLLSQSNVASISSAWQSILCSPSRLCVCGICSWSWQRDLKGLFRSFEYFRFHKVCVEGFEVMWWWFSCTNSANGNVLSVNGYPQIIFSSQLSRWGMMNLIYDHFLSSVSLLSVEQTESKNKPCSPRVVRLMIGSGILFAYRMSTNLWSIHILHTSYQTGNPM